MLRRGHSRRVVNQGVSDAPGPAPGVVVSVDTSCAAPAGRATRRGLATARPQLTNLRRPQVATRTSLVDDGRRAAHRGCMPRRASTAEGPPPPRPPRRGSLSSLARWVSRSDPRTEAPSGTVRVVDLVFRRRDRAPNLKRNSISSPNVGRWRAPVRVRHHSTRSFGTSHGDEQLA
jgi:hypothetical protein